MFLRVSWVAVLLALGCSAGAEKEGATGNLRNDSARRAGADGGGLDEGDPDVPYDPDAACVARSFRGKTIPLTVAVVFDTSLSMGVEARMTTAQAGLKKAFSNPKFDDVAVALIRFGVGGCLSDSTPFFGPSVLKESRALLGSKIDALAPAGMTPTYSGLSAAYGWLTPKTTSKTPPMDGKVAVILVTDGAPTCGVYPVPAYVDLVTKARAATIDTFVIGLPGSGEPIVGDSENTHSSVLLTKLAAAGTDLANLPAGCATDPKPVTAPVANPCYFDLQKDGLSVDSLSKALDSIRTATTSCEYALPTADPKYDLSNPGVVVVDAAGAPKTLPKCENPASPPAGGCWDWSDAKKTRVKIFGAACSMVKSDERVRVDVLLQCRPK